ncbi:MurR/RpiR family transcriptional regulator [Erysipelothrix inopinata]|uniref:MurR/RpiR family transcriptional regulator n=1 Tax=Erysipelothrix inopinata TaxID=225084 RepID=A0A7G9S1N4_9FIRM|nr:MurR/RpiR family transcriptional regulator [Erysipelothrix inopinata]QNN61759.1 MurR/RpiR family transcriptional regulator [Erysipelothrix inopinata]
MILNRFGLLYSLFSILNQKNQSDADYIIAKYLLENYENMGDLNIYDVADSCYVSRYTVRRFCQAIGFENFSDLKKQFTKYDDAYEKYLMIYQHDDFNSYFMQEVNDTAKAINAIDDSLIEDIASKINDSSEVVFLTSSIGATAVAQFQQGMIFANKVIQVVGDHFENHHLLNSLDEDDLLIVLSGSAGIAKSIVPQLKQYKVKTVLMTMNEDVDDLSEYDHIYSLRNVSTDDALSVVHIKYGFMFFLDRLLSYYISEYSEKGNM